MSDFSDMTPDEIEAALNSLDAEPVTAREEAEVVAAAYGWVGLPQTMQAREDVQTIIEAVEQMRALDASMRPAAEARLDASKWQRRAAYRVRWALVKRAGLITLGTIARRVLPWVLDTINRNGFIGWRDQKDFAAALSVRPSHMSEAMTELASADLIRRTGTHRTGLSWSDEQEKIVPVGRGWSYTFGRGGYNSFEALLEATTELPRTADEVPKSGTSTRHREVPKSGTSKSVKFPDPELQKVEVPDFRKTRGTSELKPNEQGLTSERKSARTAFDVPVAVAREEDRALGQEQPSPAPGLDLGDDRLPEFIKSGPTSGSPDGATGSVHATDHAAGSTAVPGVVSEASPTATPPPAPAPSPDYEEAIAALKALAVPSVQPAPTLSDLTPARPGVITKNGTIVATIISDFGGKKSTLVRTVTPADLRRMAQSIGVSEMDAREIAKAVLEQWIETKFGGGREWVKHFARDCSSRAAFGSAPRANIIPQHGELPSIRITTPA